jgi:hypothetical protein
MLHTKPPHVSVDSDFGLWFASLAQGLLNEVDFLVAGQPYRFAEVEAYYHGEGHLDLFTHCDPLQSQLHRWYFHRTAGQYRSGSFKGLDLTLGDGKATFGMLIRAIIGPDDNIIDGPSLTVDHLLAKTGARTVSELDRTIAGRTALDESSPLAIRAAATPRTAPVLSTPRVGLSLKKHRADSDAPRFVTRRYRYVTEPRRLTKGKPHMVLALYQDGKDTDAIHTTTGVPKKSIERYVADFAAGKAAADFVEYVGIDLGTAELCRLAGTCSAKFESGR